MVFIVGIYKRMNEFNNTIQNESGQNRHSNTKCYDLPKIKDRNEEDQYD